MMYFKKIHCHEHSEVRKSAQMKWPFYVIRAHRSIPYNPVHVEGHSSSGRYCSHHTISPQMLPISGLQQCAVVVPTAGKKYLPQTCMDWIRDRYKQWETVTLMLQLLAQRGWVNALAKGDNGNQQKDQELTYWAGLFTLKLSVTERTSFSLVNFSEHALLFKRWWNISKEHVHYWCLSGKFLLTSASFHLYNASFNEPFAPHWGSPIHV